MSDGGSRGNPGQAACAYIIYSITDKQWQELEKFTFQKNTTSDNFEEWSALLDSFENIQNQGIYLGVQTNNQAEWLGLFHGLTSLSMFTNNQKPSRLGIYLDSQLVIKQLTGEYKVKDTKLKPIYDKVQNLLVRYEQKSFRHVYRKYNEIADYFCNEVLDLEGY